MIAPSPPSTVAPKPAWAKYVAGLGVALAAMSAFVSSMNPQVAFYLMAGSSATNAFAAYLGWSSP